MNITNKFKQVNTCVYLACYQAQPSRLQVLVGISIEQTQFYAKCLSCCKHYIYLIFTYMLRTIYLNDVNRRRGKMFKKRGCYFIVFI